MLKIENLHVSLIESKQEIIRGFNLEINPGEVHLLNGKNGSGKSTLVNSIMGNPSFATTEGSIQIINEKYSQNILNIIDPEFINQNLSIENQFGINLEITSMEPNERALAGIFLATQYPVEIPGVSLSSYLRLIYNSRRPKEEQLPVFKFKKLLEEKATIINYPLHLLKRNLNEGFSGGEKKKTEILQMLILEPKYIMLDEIDSGLDKHSVKEVFQGLVSFKKLYPESSFIIITHYEKIHEYLTPNFIHEISDGKLVA